MQNNKGRKQNRWLDQLRAEN